MNTRFAANVSIFTTFSLLLLSFSFGFHNYSQTEKAVITDLNQALQQTIIQNTQLWMNQDSLRTYSRLSSLFGNPVSIESYNKNFAEALTLPLLKEQSGIIIQIKNKKQQRNPQSTLDKKEAGHYLTSDTVIWLSANAATTDTFSEEIGISFQGYTLCSVSILFLLTDKTLPGLFLCIAILFGCFTLYLFRSGKASAFIGNKETAISYGNLTLLPDTASFFKENQDKLKLTPKQYTLMEMFFFSSTHILTRTEICEALWPGKINADETLNTLVKRLRPLIEENCNLKITTDRGRAYILEICAK